jgi:chemotaxis protein methyltransferase CheR
MTGSSTHIWTGDDLSDPEFEAIAELLRDRRQFDLGQYKDRCIRRRIAKRLRACQVDDFASYLKKLEVDRDELDTLLATISIHVSQFFRNPDTFRILEQKVLPDLCRRARAAGRTELTLWSAGCASGEEPYSLALMVDDLGATDLNIRILATDISKPVLKTAQRGIFEATRVREIPPEVLENYFYLENGNYQLIDRVREKVEFLRHNIMTADEYPAADLILCRNVMIYFTRLEQERILSRFAVALPEHGALVLGRSETLTGNIRCYYQSEFPVERVYRRTAEPATAPAVEGTVPEGISVSVDCCP